MCISWGREEKGLLILKSGTKTKKDSLQNKEFNVYAVIRSNFAASKGSSCVWKILENKYDDDDDDDDDDDGSD